MKACRARLGLASRDRIATSKQANGGAERSIRELRTGGMTLLTCLEEKLEAKIDHSHVPAAWAIRHWAWLHNRHHVSLRKAVRGTAYEAIHEKPYRDPIAQFGETVAAKTLTDPVKRKLVPWQKAVWVGKSTVSNKRIVLSASGASDARTIRKLGEPGQKTCVFSAKGSPWDYAKGATGVSLRNGDRERVPGIIAGLPDDEAAEEPESDGDPVEAAAILLKHAVDDMAKREREPGDKLKGIPPPLSAAVAGPVGEDELIGKPAPSTPRVGQDIPTTPGMEPLPGIKSSGSGVS